MNSQSPPVPSGSPSPSRKLHGFAVFAACCAFCLIIAGGLVTSNDAGLSVPDWPLSYGKLMPPMVGGIFYEHGHRMVATFVGMLTVILAIWISRAEKRAWVRMLGWIVLAGIILQGLLGGLTVLYFLPPAISMAHASLAQAVFCVLITLAVVTGTGWLSDRPEAGKTGSAGLRRLSLSLVAAIYVQLILGAGTRHNAIGATPHVVGAVIILCGVFWIVVFTGRHFTWEWRRRTYALLGVVLAQSLLGVVTLLVKMGDVDAPQPTPQRVWSATSHVALGALLLALSLVFALRVHRHFRAGGLREQPMAGLKGALPNSGSLSNG